MTHWLHFDGTVDALWIENLNTVLDATKVLCLSNGERIKVPNNLIITIETHNLIAATPATIGRCGIVYFDTNDIGWNVLIKVRMDCFRLF